jgi:MOSC domain-containing protein
MITLDPETAKPSPDVLRMVTQAHDGMAGVYGAVLVEGTVRQGDDISLLN